MKITSVKVQVAGKSYQLSGTEEPEHFQHLAQMTDRRVTETARQNPDLGSEACAVAAALSLADELVKAQKIAARLRRQLEELQKDELDEA